MSTKFNEVAATFKNKVHSRFSDKSEEIKVNEAFRERRIALFFLIVSSLHFLLKVGRFYFGGQWSTVFTVLKDNSVMATLAVWSFWLSVEWIVTPILSGLAMALVTWCTVYLDSYIPGVFPPSPLSPKQMRLHARTFHMGYYLAVINGIILAGVMLHTNLNHPSLA